MTTVLDQWNHFLENYRGDAVSTFCAEHIEVPVLAVVAYFTLIFYIPDKMKNRPAFKLRWSFCLWNLFLAAFSITGSYYTVPALVNVLTRNGFRHSICGEPSSFFYNGAPGFFVALFILSKIPELLDTVFLVLQKKQVIFLHWFHHTTVMLFCWHAMVSHIASGLWFATMNFVVHAIMYSYYFFMALSPATRKIVKPAAMSITSLQLAQMVMGMIVCVATRYYMITSDEKCWADNANNKLGLLMYTSYFILFGALFRDHYCNGRSKQAKKDPSEDTSSAICNAAGTTVKEIRSGRERPQSPAATK